MGRNRRPSRRPPGDRARGEETTGHVVRLQSRHAVVDLADGQRVRCTLRKTLFRDLGRFTKPVAVGDHVHVTVFGPKDAVVESVQPRKGWLARRQADTGLEQVIVANVDQVLVTVSLREPDFRPRIIDRILVAAERAGFASVIAFTKTDLVDDRAPYEEYARLYEDLDYRTLFLSAETGEGVDELKEILRGKTTVLTGQSGVGKSTILNAVQPGLELRAQTVSDKWGKGRHTTTSTSLIALEMGGYVADTPGVRSWGIAGLEASDIGIFFRDLAPYVDDCRYNECTHDHEPECAVKAALADGKLDPRRYESYLRIILGMEDEEDGGS